jgi:hypothetical protein
MAELEDHCSMSTSSIHITDRKALLEAFELCVTYPFQTDMANDMSLMDYQTIRERYLRANMDDVIKNLITLCHIESRAYELPVRSAKGILTKIFGDTHGYGDFYQRFVALKDFKIILKDHTSFIAMLRTILTTPQQKVLFMDDAAHAAKQKTERIIHLKKQLIQANQKIISGTSEVTNITRLLKELGESV